MRHAVASTGQSVELAERGVCWHGEAFGVQIEL